MRTQMRTAALSLGPPRMQRQLEMAIPDLILPQILLLSLYEMVLGTCVADGHSSLMAMPLPAR